MDIEVGHTWRSSSTFVLCAVGAGFFSEFFIAGLTAPILPRLLEDRLNTTPEQTALDVAYLNSALSLSTILFSPLVGITSPVFGTKKIPFVVGLLVMFGGTSALVFGNSLELFLFGRIAQGLSTAVIWIVALAMVCDTVSTEKLALTIGTLLGFGSLGTLIAPPCGGALYRASGMLGYGLVAAIVLLIDLILRLLVVESNPQSQEGQDNAEHVEEHEPLLDGISRVKRTPRFSISILKFLVHGAVVLGLLCELINGLLLSALYTTIPIRANAYFNMDVFQTGLLFLPVTVAMAIMGVFSGWTVGKFGSLPVAMFAFPWMGVSTALLGLPLPSQVSWYGVLLVSCGGGINLNTVPGVTWASGYMERYHRENPETFGPAGPQMPLFGFFSMAFEIGRMLGPLLASSFSQLLGYMFMCVVLGGIAVLAGIWTGWYAWRQKITSVKSESSEQDNGNEERAESFGQTV